jgi:hypothetical protein
MKDKKSPAWSRFLLFISPLSIPIAIWFFFAHGFEIIMSIFFTIWQFIWGFFDGSFGDSGYDPYNDFK